MGEFLGPMLLLLPSLLLLVLALTAHTVISKLSRLQTGINAIESARERVLRAIREDLTQLRSEISSHQAHARETRQPDSETFSEPLLTRIDEAVAQAARAMLASLTDRLDALSLPSKSELEALADSQRSHTPLLTDLAAILQHLSTELRELRNQRRTATDDPVLRALTELRQQHDALRQSLDAVTAKLDRLSTPVSQLPQPAEITEIAKPPGSTEAQSQTVTRNATGGHIEPVDRGGRSRGASTPTESPRERHLEGPELVCRKRQGHWILGVHVPERLLEEQQPHVLQDTVLLARDDHDESLWLLAGITGTISIRGSAASEIVLGSSKTLTFKLSRDCAEGRRVRSLTSGLYLVVVPISWSLDVEGGPQPLAIEPVAVPGFHAFVFDLEEGEADALRWLGERGQPVGTLPLRSDRFKLIGHRLNDSTPQVGPLFGGSAPRVEATRDNGWHDVDLIVIGAEGRGPARWRTEYVPNPSNPVQDLSSALAGTAGGWYFLRFYDHQHELIDSMDFRFLNALTDIRCPSGLLYPGPDGHEPIDLEFLHDDTCIVIPADESPTRDLHHVRTHNGTLATLPPDPRCDLTTWHVHPNAGGDVPVTVRLRRLWWELGDENAPGLTWSARRLTCRLHDFAPTSGTVLWLLGLTSETHRPSLVELDPGTTTRQIHFFEDLARVPMREFCDAPELQKPGTIRLRLRVEPPDTMPSVCLAESPIRLGCRWCRSLCDTFDLLIEHIAASHLDELLPPLTYEETYALLRQSIPSLPSAIYRCSYCTFYAQAEDPHNPTSVISNHIQDDCQAASRPDGTAQVSFHVIRDVQEVRDNVIPNVPEIRRCSLCGEHFTSPSRRDMMEHLRQHPSRSLGELS